MDFIITKPLLHEMLKGLKKKKTIKTMSDKVAINTYVISIESKKQTKQTRTTEIASWLQGGF